MNPFSPDPRALAMARRTFLRRSGAGLGALALGSLQIGRAHV